LCKAANSSTALDLCTVLIGVLPAIALAHALLYYAGPRSVDIYAQSHPLTPGLS
jgi:hypothetical protein